MQEVVNALQEAIRAAGGIPSFAKAVHAPSVHAVKSWIRIGSVPADYCPTIERITGVPVERLRPSCKDWAYLRGTHPTQTPTQKAC